VAIYKDTDLRLLSFRLMTRNSPTSDGIVHEKNIIYGPEFTPSRWTPLILYSEEGALLFRDLVNCGKMSVKKARHDYGGGEEELRKRGLVSYGPTHDEHVVYVRAKATDYEYVGYDADEVGFIREFYFKIPIVREPISCYPTSAKEVAALLTE